jgi:hypothetical protein
MMIMIRFSYSNEDIENEKRKNWDTGQDCALVRDATRQVVGKRRGRKRDETIGFWTVRLFSWLTMER